SLVGGFWSPSADLTPDAKITAESRPSAFVRSDHVSTVIYTGTDHAIHGITNTGSGWGPPEVIATPVQVKSRPHGYRRIEGTNAVVYLGSDGRIHELTWQRACWIDGDLTVAAGDFADLPANGFDPIGLVRGDGINVVYYRSTSGHIRELALRGG